MSNGYGNPWTDIDRWQDGYTPEHTDRLPGPEILTDGQSYEFEIVGAELALTKQNPEPIFRLRVRVLNGDQAGVTIERPAFFRRQESVNYLGGDLQTLGLDAAQWGRRGKPWSRELLDACPRLIGIRFSGTKTTSEDGYANLWINHRLGGQSRPPARQSAPAGGYGPPPATARASAPGATAPTQNTDDDIPF